MPRARRDAYTAVGRRARRTVVEFTDAELRVLDRAASLALNARKALARAAEGALRPHEEHIDALLAGIEIGAAEALRTGRIEREEESD